MNHFEPINIPDIDLVEAFKYSVDQYGQKPAMIFLDEKISYKKYDVRFWAFKRQKITKNLLFENLMIFFTIFRHTILL